MTRELDQASLDALKAREGLKLTAYKDQGGVWTIGYGHTGVDVHEGLTITQDEADGLLEQDCAWACATVEKAVMVPLNDAQFGALVSFCFNVGPGEKGVRDGFVVLKSGKPSTVLAKLNAGDYASVPSEMLKWVNANGMRDDGLVNRRNSEGGQWVKGAYVRGASITPDPPSKWHQNPTVRRIGAAAATAIAGASADTIKSAADAANGAVSVWHGFGAIGAGLTVLFVAWAVIGIVRKQ